MWRCTVLVSAGLLVASMVPRPAVAATGSSPPPSLSCSSPTTSQSDAPAVGSSATYDAADAGSAEVAHSEAMTLRVVSTLPRPGWRGDAIYPTGQTVKVIFYDTTKRGSQVRLTVALDNSGRYVHVRVVTCS